MDFENRQLRSDFKEVLSYPFFWKPMLPVFIPNEATTYYYNQSSVTTIEDGKMRKQVKENNNGEIRQYEETTDLTVSDPVTNKKRKHVRWKE